MAKLLWALEVSRPEKNNEPIFLVAVAVRNSKLREDLRSFSSRGDDLSKKGWQDDIRINSRQAWERKYWSKKLGISEEELLRRVKEKGPLVRNLK